MVLLRPAPIPNHSLPPPILPCPLPLAFLLTPSFFLSQTLSVLLSFLPYPLSLGISRHYLGLGSYFPYPLGHYSEKLFLPTSFHFSFLFSPSQVSLGILGDSLPFHVSYHVSLSSSLRSRSLSGRFGLLWVFSGPFGGFFGLFRNSPLLYFSFPLPSFPSPPLILTPIPYLYLIPPLFPFRSLSSWVTFGIFRSPLECSPLVTIPTASSTILTPLFTIPTSLGHYSEKLFFTYHYSLSVPILPLSPPPPAHWLSLGLFQGFSGFLCAFPPLYTPFPGRFFSGRGMFRPLFGILRAFFSFLSFFSLLYIYLGLFGYFWVSLWNA